MLLYTLCDIYSGEYTFYNDYITIFETSTFFQSDLIRLLNVFSSFTKSILA